MQEGYVGHESHGDMPFLIPVSVTMSILAVLVAAVTLLGHRAHTEEILLQTKATDQWAYFQAKNIRLHEMESFADMLGVLSAQDQDKAAGLRGKYLKQAEKYTQDKEEIGGQATELEKERNMVSRRADRFDGGEVLLEIALVISSLTLLTKRRLFWFSGMVIAAAGLLFAMTGFFIH